MRNFMVDSTRDSTSLSNEVRSLVASGGAGFMDDEDRLRRS